MTWLVALLVMLLSPCQSCDWGDEDTPRTECVEFICGTYNMDGTWTADLHEYTWRVGPNGERTYEYERDTTAKILIGSTGCGVSFAKQIPGLAQDDKIVFHADFEEYKNTDGSWIYQWSWRGECTVEKCFLDVELSSSTTGGPTVVERAQFTFTNLVRLGEE